MYQLVTKIPSICRQDDNLQVNMFDIAVRCIIFITGDISFWHFTASQVIHSLLLYILDVMYMVLLYIVFACEFRTACG